MKKILILGKGGAGKTTFADKLAKATNLPVTHLDNLFWKEGLVRAYSPSEWEEKLIELMKKDAWILDGNYHQTLDLRLEKADTVFLYDIHPIRALLNKLKRKFSAKQTPGDTVKGLHQEGSLWRLIRDTYRFPTKRVLEKIRNHKIENVHIIKNYKQAGVLLENTKPSSD